MEYQVESMVEHYQLQSYSSKYQTRCAICRKDIHVGEEIARIPLGLLGEMHQIGLSMKVFKYAHSACFPNVIPRHQSEAVRVGARMLQTRTDPKWPRDYAGFSAGDASPCCAWLDLGEPEYYTQEVAKKLRKYIKTQLGGLLSEEECQAIQVPAR